MKLDYFIIPEITVSYKDNAKTSERLVVKCSRDASEVFALAHKDCMEHHEEVYVLLLNKANRVLGISCVGKGGLDTAPVDIRIVLQTALKCNATALMLSHNHPSGSAKPSREDIRMTGLLKEGCEAVGLQLLDHLIMTGETYYSFADEGTF